MRKTAVVVAGLLVIGSQPAWAARTKAHEAAESAQYGQKFGGMIGRGALNVITSPVDIIVNIVNESKAGPPLVGTLVGVGKGLGCGVLRLGSGAVDLVTFWVPGFNGFPVSDSYDNCMATGGSSVSMETAPSGGESVSSWEVPTAEPGAAQTPTPVPPTAGESEQPAKKSWKK
jgi:putative exosortase-associated protein (TIGR04073 family)